MNLSDFKALTFDCYGTLIDWESGMITALEPLTSKVASDLSRNDILEMHARHESAQQKLTPNKKYSELLAVVYKRMAEQWGVNVEWQACVAYGQSVRHWPAFDDSVESLSYLKKYFKLYILSNVDNESFAYSQARLGVAFDGVFTAEDIGSYKPAERNFEYMIGQLAEQGIEKHEILHVAESMFHDHEPANTLSIANCHIYRRSDQEGFGATMIPKSMPVCHFRFDSMQALADAHRSGR